MTGHFFNVYIYHNLLDLAVPFHLSEHSMGYTKVGLEISVTSLVLDSCSLLEHLQYSYDIIMFAFVR